MGRTIDMELFEIVEKAQEDYNITGTYICEKNGENDRLISKVNDKITIEFRNNNIVRTKKSKTFWILYNKFVSVINDLKMIKYMWS